MAERWIVEGIQVTRPPERGARRTAAMKARVSQGSQSGAGSAESGGKYQGRQPSPVWFAAQATLHSNKQADWV